MSKLSYIASIVFFYCLVCAIPALQSQAMSQKPKPEKLEKVDQAHQASTKLQGKSTGYFQVSLLKKDNGNGDISLIALVRPQKDMVGSKIQWKVPEGVDMVSGDLLADSDFKAGEEQTFSIVLSGDSLKNKDQIFFFVYKEMRGERYGGTQSYVHSVESDVSKSEASQKPLRLKKPRKIYQ